MTERSDIVLAHTQGLAAAGHLGAAAHLIVTAVEPSNLQGTALAARCFIGSGDPDSAILCLETGSVGHGWDPETRYLFATALAYAGQGQRAIEVAMEVTNDPEYGAAALALLAELRLVVNRSQMDEVTSQAVVALARAAAEAAVEAAPDDATTHLTLAKVAEHEGEMDERLAELELASRLAPGDPDVGTALGLAYLDAGRRTDGQRELGAVLARYPNHVGAASALHNSSVRAEPSPRRRRTLQLAYALGPVMLGLAAALFASRTEGGSAFGSFVVYLLIGVVIVRLIERWRTDAAVADIQRQALRAHPREPMARWASVSLIVIGLLAIGISIPTAVFLRDEAADPNALLWTLGLCQLAGVALIFGGARSLSRAKRTGSRIPSGACRCQRLVRLSGKVATKYDRTHLRPDIDVTPDGVRRRRCDLLGFAWLLFPEGNGSSEPAPLLLRLPEGFLPSGGSGDPR